MHKFGRALPIIALLWLFLWIRLIDITTLPYFIDEVHHIHRGRIVYDFKDLHVSTTPSKFLLYYWLGLFNLPPNLPGWMARSAVALFSLIGAAGTFGITRRFFGTQAAYLAVIILLFFPFMLFHERMALTDPFTASLVIMMAWWALIYANRPSQRRATILGILITFMLAGKILTTPLLVIPPAAIFFFSAYRYERAKPLRPQLYQMWKVYRPTLLHAYLIVFWVWVGILFFYFFRGLIDPVRTKPIVDDYIYQSPNRFELIQMNIEHLGEVLAYFWSPLLAGLNVVGIGILLWKMPRQALFLLLGAFPLWAILTLAAARPNSRYLSVVGHFWVILMAGGLIILGKMLGEAWQRYGIPQKLGYGVSWLLIGVWIITYGLPFDRTLNQEPHKLELPEREIRGYFSNFTGYGFLEAFDALKEQPSVSAGTDKRVVLGIVRLCEYLHYHIAADEPILIKCLPDDSQRRHENLNLLLDEYGGYYLMWEQTSMLTEYIDLTKINGHMELIARFQRPHNGLYVELYLVQKD